MRSNNARRRRNKTYLQGGKLARKGRRIKTKFYKGGDIMKKINWYKVGANGGIAFFSTLAGTTATIGINPEVSIASGLITAGLALCTEIKLESEPITKAQDKLAVGLLV